MPDRDLLERLMIDEALGALSPDAAKLLDSCLDSDAALRAEAEAFRHTVVLAGGALRSQPAPVLPEFPHHLMPSPDRKVIPFPRFALALAASFVLGLAFAGIALQRRGTATAQASNRPSVLSAAAALPAPQPERAAVPTFWSRERWHQPAQRKSESPRVRWSSPVSRPEIQL